MFKYSAGIILDNGYGWSVADGTITCDMNNSYIAYDFQDMEDSDVSAAVDAEYENEPLLPGVGAEAAGGAEGKMSAFWGKMVASSSTKIESLKAGMDRIKIHIPRWYLISHDR